MHATLEDMTRAMKVNATYVSRILRLTLLAPEIVEAILDGRQPAELQLDDLLDWVPLEWQGQFGLICGKQDRREWQRKADIVGPPSGFRIAPLADAGHITGNLASLRAFARRGIVTPCRLD